MTFKSFVKWSKFVTDFKHMGFFKKIIFYLEVPYRYLKFKKIYKKEKEN